MTQPRRPLRSVWVGNSRYLSVYGLGVAQAMSLLGHWHRSVSLFDGGDVAKQIEEMAPDVIWTHMALWPPDGSISAAEMVSILGRWKRRGAAVFLHDGDPRKKDIPDDLDVEAAFTHALVNRSVDPAPWPVPCLRWPYAAMPQKEIGPLVEAWRCDLLFAGILRRDGELYGQRTQLVWSLFNRLGPERFRIITPGGGDVNNRMLVAEVAPSAGAVLGFARPDVPGWIDTRVFQYPGAGGVLIHDDAGEYLWAREHYIRVDRGNIDMILAAVEQAKTDGPAMRERAFRYVQQHHTWINRVEQALGAFYGGR